MECRLGDASANPYLVIGGLLAAAYLGVLNKIDPGPALEGYGYDVTRSPKLPQSLGEALDALEADTAMREVLGDTFVNTFVTYKRDEISRFQAWITDWEFDEYTYHL